MPSGSVHANAGGKLHPKEVKVSFSFKCLILLRASSVTVEQAEEDAV